MLFSPGGVGSGEGGSIGETGGGGGVSVQLLCQEKYAEQQLASVARKEEFGIQLGWSPSFLHVFVLSQSGYHGFTATATARDTRGV
jgi:hypothetical protein